MSKETFDVIVIGLGAHGSSALYHLSKTGQKVLGIDRYMPPHDRGSSHGQSRIIRQAYHENPVYVPFVKAAYTLWEEMERETGEKLLIETGGLLLGTEDSTVVTGARLSAETHGIAYDYLNASELGRRFPAFRPAEDTVAVWEKRAGILFPEDCISTHLKGGMANGVSVRCDETVLAILPQSGGWVEVVTSKSRYAAAKVIVSAGALCAGSEIKARASIRPCCRETCPFISGNTCKANCSMDFLIWGRGSRSDGIMRAGISFLMSCGPMPAQRKSAK